jgi:hypothetical protein
MIVHALAPGLGLAPLSGTAATAAPPPAGSYVITDVTVIPLDTDELLRHRSVLIRDDKVGRIAAQ